MAMRVGLFMTCIIAIFASVAQGRHHVVPSPPPMAPAPASNLVPAPGPGPATWNDCTTLMFDMLPCLDYITDVENVTRPPKACCEGFETVLQTGPNCLCDALAQSGSMGVSLNLTKAFALPSTCRSSITPPTCKLPSPSAAPTPTPTPTPTPSQDKPPVLSSTSSPAPAPASSSSTSSAKFQTMGLVFGFVVALLY